MSQDVPPPKLGLVYESPRFNAIKTGSALKVFMYIARWTAGESRWTFGPCRMSEIAAGAGLTRESVSRAVRSLERLGLIHVERSPLGSQEGFTYTLLMPEAQSRARRAAPR